MQQVGAVGALPEIDQRAPRQDSQQPRPLHDRVGDQIGRHHGDRRKLLGVAQHDEHRDDKRQGNDGRNPRQRRDERVAARPLHRQRQHAAAQDRAIRLRVERADRGQQRGRDRRRGKPRIGVPGHQEHDRRKQQIEFQLDADGPRMREDAVAVGVGVFRIEAQEVGQPHRERFIIVRQQRQARQPIDQDRHPVARHDPEKPFDQERPERDAPVAFLLPHHQHRHQIPADGEEQPHRRPALQVAEQRHARNVRRDHHQEADAAHSVECRTMAVRQVFLVAQLAGSAFHWRCPARFGNDHTGRGGRALAWLDYYISI